LRSADEGSTIFYSCDCGHKYVEVEISFYVWTLITGRWNTNNWGERFYGHSRIDLFAYYKGICYDR
jgi:hypothetical protein